MRVALVNPPWDFTGSIYFGCREPHLPLELGACRVLLEAAGHEVRGSWMVVGYCPRGVLADYEVLYRSLQKSDAEEVHAAVEEACKRGRRGPPPWFVTTDLVVDMTHARFPWAVSTIYRASSPADLTAALAALRRAATIGALEAPKET